MHRQAWRNGKLWSGLFAASLAGTAASGWMSRVDLSYYMLCGILALAAFIMVPLAMRLCWILLVRWAPAMGVFIKAFTEDELSAWLRTQLRFFDFSFGVAFAGVTLGSVAVVAFGKGGFLDKLAPFPAAWLTVLMFFAGFMAGWGLWAMLGGANAFWKLGRTYRDRIVVTRGRFGITSIGRVLAQCWIVIAAAWFVFTSSALLGPSYATLWDFLRSYPVMLLAAPTMPLIVGCFVLSQLTLHDAMLMYKRRETARFEAMLEELTPDQAAGYTKERQETIEFLQRRLADAEDLPNWPFNSTALAGVGGSALGAVFPVVVEGLLTASKVKELMDV